MDAEIQGLLRQYDDCTDEVQCELIVARLDAVRTRLHATAYMNGLPVPGAPDFACAIARRPEFARHGSRPRAGATAPADPRVACAGDQFALTQHQVFVKHYMQTYNGLLLFHGVGTGKTCTAITAAEAMLQQGLGRYRRPALVVMPRALKQRFRRQVFDAARSPDAQCTGGEYLRMIPHHETLRPEDLERRVDRIIGERYELYSFAEFANHVQRMVDTVHGKVADPDERAARVARSVRALMSDRLVVIDEAHNIKTEEEASNKIVPPLVELAVRHAHNCKLLLMTATPMFDRASEIVWLMNLLLLNDKRPLLDVRQLFSVGGGGGCRKGNSKGNSSSSEESTVVNGCSEDGLLPGAAEKLAQAFRGYVSHVDGRADVLLFPLVLPTPAALVLRASAYPGVDAAGQRIPKHRQLRDTAVVASAMRSGDLQQAAYELLARSVWNKGDEKLPSTALSTLVEASNLVYPAADVADRVGSRGLAACFSRTAGGQYAYVPAVRKRHGDFLAMPHLERFAPKLATVMRLVRKATGIVFVYSRWLASGLVPLAMALEHAGYRRYRRPNLLASAAATANNAGPCYVLLSGDPKLSPDNDRDIAAVNDDANAWGSNVKVVLCSTVGTEGLDFRNVREMHLLEPWYNFSRMRQTVGRAVRRCSHVALPVAHRNVTVYRHVCMLPPGAAARESVDFRTYRMAENKQRVIDQLEASMKANAVDCVLNRPPSARTYVMDVVTSQGTRIRKYRHSSADPIECSCAGGGGNGETFDLTMGHDDPAPYVRRIVEMFRDPDAKHSYDSIRDTCQAALPRFDDATLLVALQHVLQDVGGVDYVGGVYVAAREEPPPRDTRLRLRPPPPPPSAATAAASPQSARRPRDNEDVFTQLHNRIERTRGALHIPASDRDLASALVDHGVDRLRSHELRMVVTALVRSLAREQVLSAFKMKVLQSLRRSGALVGAWPLIDFYFDPELQTFHHVLPSGEVVPCTAQQAGAVRLRLPFDARSLPDGYTGFVAFRHGVPQFKLLHDGKEHTHGYVCHQTSMLSVGDLRARIAATNRQLLRDSHKYVKTVMCDAYEVALRARGDAAFARPLHHFLVHRPEPRR